MFTSSNYAKRLTGSTNKERAGRARAAEAHRAGTQNFGMPSRPANPKGIVSSSPGLRACELPWDIVQTASQPQRGCGRARHPRTQPRWGWFVLTRWTQGSSLLATLGFVAESLRDSHESSPEMWVMMSPQERVNRARVLWSLVP